MDECPDGTHNCPFNSKCILHVNPSGHTCKCNTGFTAVQDPADKSLVLCNGNYNREINPIKLFNRWDINNLY